MDRRRWIVLGLVVALVAAFVALRRAIGLELEPESMRAVIGEMGVWAPLVFVGIVVFRVPLLVPSQVVLIGGGLVFGTVEGTIYGAVGLLLSAFLLFLSSRWAGREAVVARVPGRLRHLLDVAGSRLGALFIAVGTGYPLGPITMYHLMAGVTGMAARVFLVAAGVGSLVRAAIYTYFGSSLVSGDVRTLATATVILALAFVVPLAVPTTRGWLLEALARSREPESAEPPPPPTAPVG